MLPNGHNMQERIKSRSTLPSVCLKNLQLQKPLKHMIQYYLLKNSIYFVSETLIFQILFQKSLDVNSVRYRTTQGFNRFIDGRNPTIPQIKLPGLSIDILILNKIMKYFLIVSSHPILNSLSLLWCFIKIKYKISGIISTSKHVGLIYCER